MSTNRGHRRLVLAISPTAVSWAQNAYTLAFGGPFFVGARAGDLFGRRRIFVFGIALFSGGSLFRGPEGVQAPGRRPRVPAGDVRRLRRSRDHPKTHAAGQQRHAGHRRVRRHGIGTAWLSRVSLDTVHLTGMVLPMIVFGIGQGLGLSTLTKRGHGRRWPTGRRRQGGLVNVAHHIGGAFGLGILVTVFAAAGSGERGARELLAQRVSASLTAAAALLVLALVVTLIARPRKQAAARDNREVLSPLPTTANAAHRAAEPRAAEKASAA